MKELGRCQEQVNGTKVEQGMISDSKWDTLREGKVKAVESKGTNLGAFKLLGWWKALASVKVCNIQNTLFAGLR